MHDIYYAPIWRNSEHTAGHDRSNPVTQIRVRLGDTEHTRILIVILPAPGKAEIFEARIEGNPEILCESHQPFLDGARALLKAGFSPDTELAMRHAGSAIVSLTARLGVAARLTVREGQTDGPRFAKWVPYSRAVTPRNAKTSLAHIMTPGLSIDVSGAAQ